MTTIAAVIGTRAQLVKMAPVILALEARGAVVHVISSGQHANSMMELAEDLGVAGHFATVSDATERSSPARLALWVLPSFMRMLRDLRAARRSGAKVCLVHGDTLSTLLGALAAKMSLLKVGHVESGLTSGRLFSPFPEEITRRLVFQLSDIAFCPDHRSAGLMGAYGGLVVVNTGGNSIEDALARVALGDPETSEEVVISIHRYENIFDRNRLTKIIEGVLAVAESRGVSFVLHPPTERQLERFGLMGPLKQCPSVKLRPRMPYTKFIRLVNDAALVVTDGGSNQEELAALGVPTLILRNETERPDGLGENAILEPEAGDWVAYIHSGKYEALRKLRRPSIGGASDRIAKILYEEEW